MIRPGGHLPGGFGSTPGRRITKPLGLTRTPAALPSSVVTPRKPKHISFVVCSPGRMIFGGVLGLRGFFVLLSYTASTVNFVPALTSIGSRRKYNSCQL